MSQYKRNAIWVAVAVVVIAAIATAVVLKPGQKDASGQDGPQQAAWKDPGAGSVPEPSDSTPDYPDEAPDYKISECEYSEEPDETAEAVSPSGEYFAGDHLRGPDDEKTDIHKAVHKQLDMSTNGETTAVNSHGTVVGASDAKTKAADPQVGWAYHDGEAVKLAVPKDLDVPDDAFVETKPSAINEDGDIAGVVNAEYTKNNRRTITHTPVKWEAGAREPTTLKAGDHGATAEAITDDGSVIGVAFGDNDPAEETVSDDGKVWKWGPDGKREELSIPAGELDIAGDWLLINGEDGSYRWNMSGDEDPEKVELDRIVDIDAAGRVFGSNGDSAVVVTDSGTEELPVRDNPPEDASFLPSAVGAKAAVISGHLFIGDEEDDEAGETEEIAVEWDCS